MNVSHTLERQALQTFLLAALGWILCTHSASAAQGGPDSYGYRFKDSVEPDGPAYSWIDISSTGSVVLSGATPTAESVVLGKAWRFYGERLEQLRVSRHGYLSADLTENGGDATNDVGLPVTPSAGGGARFYVLHDSLNLDAATGRVLYEYFPVSPHAWGKRGAHVFTWENAHHPSSTQLFDFQAILFDEGDMVCQFPSGNPENGAGSTTGIQNADASIGLQALGNQLMVTPLAIAFHQPRFVVTTRQLTGAGSITEALADAALENRANVVFDPAAFASPKTIAVNGTTLTVAEGTHIYGPRQTLTLNGGTNALPIMNVTKLWTGYPVILTDLRLTGGQNGIESSNNTIIAENTRFIGASEEAIVVSGVPGIFSIEVRDCLFRDCARGIYSRFPAKMAVLNSAFQNHTEGALYAESTEVLIQGSSFHDNTGTNVPAAVEIAFPQSVVVRDSEFRGNVSTGEAVVCIRTSTGFPELAPSSLFNCSFTGNVGGALALNVNASLTNVTMAGNRSDTTFQGGGLFVTSTAEVEVQNCIFRGNVLNGSPSDPRGSILGDWGESTINVAHTILEHSGGSDDWQLKGIAPYIIDAGNNLDADPRFIGPRLPMQAPTTAGDYRLAPSSVARDLGDNSVDLDGSQPGTLLAADLPLDLGGRARVEDGTIDAGAHEVPNDTSTLPPYPIIDLPNLIATTDILVSPLLDLTSFFDPKAKSFLLEDNSFSGATVTVDDRTGLITFQSAPGVAGDGFLEVSAEASNGARTRMSIPLRVLTVLRVAPGADPSNSLFGDSWANATNLQRALFLAPPNTQIWALGGTYYPNEGLGTTGTESDTFTIDQATHLIGGFSGREDEVDERTPETNTTTFSGAIGSPLTTVIFSVSDAFTLEDATVTTSSGPSTGRAVDHVPGGSGYEETIVILRRCHFFAHGGSAVLDLKASASIIEDCHFANNYAIAIKFGTAFSEEDRPRIIRCTFEDSNQSAYGGSAIKLEGGADIIDCTFRDNQSGFSGGYARDGAAIHVSRVTTEDYPVAVDGCLFENNLVYGSGAFSSYQRSFTLSRCTFRGNTASENGGAVAADNADAVSITNCLFTGNHADTSASDDGGGACHFENCSPILTNCTFVGNRSTLAGGAFFSRTSDVGLTNCLFWENTVDLALPASRLPDDFATDSQNSGSPTMNPTFRRCLLQGSLGSANWTVPAGDDLGGNLDADPLFLHAITADQAPTTAGDFHVIGWSPVINQGANTTAAGILDLAGDARRRGSRVDIGVYETLVSSRTADADGDGLPNAYEFAYTSEPRSMTDLLPTADPDDDGNSVLAEFYHGLDPMTAQPDGLSVRLTPQANGMVKVTIESSRSINARDHVSADLAEIIGMVSQELMDSRRFTKTVTKDPDNPLLETVVWEYVTDDPSAFFQLVYQAN